MNPIFKLISILVVLVFVINYKAEARIAYYDVKGTGKTIGAGSQIASTPTGVIVLDLDTLEGTSISATTFKVGKTTYKNFGVVELDNYLWTTLIGPNSQTYTVVSKAEQPSTQFKNCLMEQSVYFGVNSSQKVDSTYGNEMLPASLSSTAANILSMNGYDFITMGTAILTLNIKVSKKYNLAGKTVDQIIKILRSGYLSKGYSETVIETL